jgi:beta-N-acetylhexosaminidase
MDLQERLGELLLVGFMGQELNDLLAAHICTLRPAGLIFFRRNIVEPEQLARLTRKIQELALEELGRPLLLAVDQEGGTVARMPPPFSQLPDAAVLGGEGCGSVSYYSGLTANEMFRVGLNVNLAPVLDVNHPHSASVMKHRSFGSEPSLVAECGVAAITATQSEKVMATAKHFPGLGRTRKDPHHDLPVISAGREDLLQHDVLPFVAAIKAKVACVMTSHTLYPELDPENPATFSPVILRGLLRDQLGYEGVVITDDLEMGAVVEQYSPEGAAIAALKAGADLLLVCNDMEKMHITAGAVRDGLNRGLIDRQDLALSLIRVESLTGKYLQPLRIADAAAVAAHFSVGYERV